MPIPTKRVPHVALVSTLPRTRRTAGFEFGGVRRGRFTSTGDSSVLLLATAGAPPYIEVRTPSEWLVLNLADSARTQRLFAELVRAKARP